MRVPQEPNRPTCPDIDKLLKIIDYIINDFASFKDTNEPEDFISSMDNAASELNGIQNELETLRRANSDLREWGKELENIIDIIQDEHRKEVGELEDIINELEQTIINYENI